MTPDRLLDAPDPLARTLADLVHGPQPGAAFERLLEVLGPNPEQALRGELSPLRALLPLVAATAEAHGLAVPSFLQTVLRSAWHREELRTATLHRVAGPSLRAVAGRSDVAVAGGAALAAVAGAEPALRHVHDLDLVTTALDDVVAVLADTGLRVVSRSAARADLAHSTGFPVVVRTEVLPGLPWRPAGDEAEVLGVEVRTVAPAGLAAHAVLAGLLRLPRTRLRWLVDASPQVAGHGARDVVAAAAGAGLEATVAWGLHWAGAITEPAPPLRQSEVARLVHLRRRTSTGGRDLVRGAGSLRGRMQVLAALARDPRP